MAVVNLPAELTTCSICNNRFGHDLDSNTSNTQHMLNPHIPIQSQNCEHYFCFGCIQNHHTDKRASWIKCFICGKGNAFQPGSPIVYRALTALASLNSDIEQDNDTSASYGAATVVQEDGVKNEAAVEAKNREITVVQEDGVKEDADVESENTTGNTDMEMRVNAAPSISIASSSMAHNASESISSGSKRKVEDISTARGDKHNENKIDISPSEGSLNQVTHGVTLTRRQANPTARQHFTVGTKLLKKFPIPYEGKVVKVPTGEDDKYYRVEYEDHDVEDYEFNELALLAKISSPTRTRNKNRIDIGTKVIKIFNMAFEGEVVQVLSRSSKKYSLGGTQKYRVKFLADEEIELMSASTLRPLVEAYANYVLVDAVRFENSGSESEDVEEEERNGHWRRNDEYEDIGVRKSAHANPEVETQGEHAIPEGTMPKVAVKTEPMDVFKYNIKTRRKYDDRVLLARQAKNGMMKLGGGNCGMDLFPKRSVKGNENHPRFRDLGDTKAMAYADLWQPDGPKYAGQECAHVGCVPDKRNPFSVFMNRTLKNGRDKLGWEYCGEYICADPEGDVVTWTSAHTLTHSQRNKMITDIVSSCKNPSGDWVQNMVFWRKRLAAALLTDPTPATAAPLWMTEDRRPTSAELEDALPLSIAARARAFGFLPGIPTAKLAEIVVRLDEFHKSKPIKFLSYDENVYNYVCKGETTRNSRGKKKCDGETCAKASDWYAHFDQQIK